MVTCSCSVEVEWELQKIKGHPHPAPEEQQSLPEPRSALCSRRGRGSKTQCRMLPKPPGPQCHPGGEGQHQTHRGLETRCPLSSRQRGHCFVFVKILLMRVTHSHSKALAQAACPLGHPRGLAGDATGGAWVASMPSCCRESGLPSSVAMGLSSSLLGSQDTAAALASHTHSEGQVPTSELIPF